MEGKAESESDVGVEVDAEGEAEELLHELFGGTTAGDFDEMVPPGIPPHEQPNVASLGDGEGGSGAFGTDQLTQKARSSPVRTPMKKRPRAKAAPDGESVDNTPEQSSKKVRRSGSRTQWDERPEWLKSWPCEAALDGSSITCKAPLCIQGRPGTRLK